MGYEDGWAAINMEAPARVPRTEYSVQRHWELVTVVTGIEVDVDSPDELKAEAGRALMEVWDFSFRWNTGINTQFMGGMTTDMGHAVYAAGGVDRREKGECPFTTPEQVLDFDPTEAFGPLNKAELVPLFEEMYRRNVEEYADAVNMSGVYTTMMSGFIALFGWDMLLLAIGTDAKRFGEFARRYESWVTPHFEALAESTLPVVMCHDDMVWTSGAIVSPAWYREYIFPAFKRLWAPILDAGKRLVFTSDGDYTEFFDDIVDCGAHALVMEPCCDMAAFAEKRGQTHGFIGNADTRILLKGDKTEIRAEVERCMAVGKPCPGFFMAVGNHIPPNTPVESCLYYNEVYNELAER